MRSAPEKTIPPSQSPTRGWAAPVSPRAAPPCRAPPWLRCGQSRAAARRGRPTGRSACLPGGARRAAHPWVGVPPGRCTCRPPIPRRRRPPAGDAPAPSVLHVWCLPWFRPHSRCHPFPSPLYPPPPSPIPSARVPPVLPPAYPTKHGTRRVRRTGAGPLVTGGPARGGQDMPAGAAGGPASACRHGGRR